MEKQYLLPPNGINCTWAKVCEKFNYQYLGFSDRKVIFETQLTQDFDIKVEDVCQHIHAGGNKELYTIVSFNKKYLEPSSYSSEQVFDCPYIIYYPYGTRPDEETLLEVGLCLNALINKARDLPENAKMLPLIKNAQQAIVNLFNTGCTDQHVIESIMSMSGVNPIYGFYDTHFRCRTNIVKDHLPSIESSEFQQELQPNT